MRVGCCVSVSGGGGLSQTVVQQITDNHKKQGVGGWGGRAVVGPKHGATRLVI